MKAMTKTEQALEELSGFANLYADSRMGPTLSRIVATLREAVTDRDRLQHTIDCANTPLMADVLKERDGLKAKVERLTEEGIVAKGVARAWEGRAEKVKAEVEQNKMLIADLTRDMNEYHDKAEKAEAELARYKRFDKLIEAVEKAPVNNLKRDLHDMVEGVGQDVEFVSFESTDAILRAALLYKEQHER